MATNDLPASSLVARPTIRWLVLQVRADAMTPERMPATAASLRRTITDNRFNVNYSHGNWDQLLDLYAERVRMEAFGSGARMDVLVEYGREFDDPLPADDIIPWSPDMERMNGPCPPSGLINNHPWHRVSRYVVRTVWRRDP